MSPTQRPLPDNTQHSQETGSHAPGGIRTRNPRKRTAAQTKALDRAATGIGFLNVCLTSSTNNGKAAELYDAGSVIKVSAGNDSRLCTNRTACCEYLVRESCQIALEDNRYGSFTYAVTDDPLKFLLTKCCFYPTLVKSVY